MTLWGVCVSLLFPGLPPALSLCLFIKMKAQSKTHLLSAYFPSGETEAQRCESLYPHIL